MTSGLIKKELRKHSDKNKAKLLQGYFKTGPGEYAEGDIFIGINVPVLRRVAAQYRGLSLSETLKLLRSRIHEERLTALLILIAKYRSAEPEVKGRIYREYLKNSKYINNWDLVDVTAKHIVGDYLYEKDRKKLHQLARSGLLWERRIAILATFYFIGKGDYKDSLKIAKALLSDGHDLIHKAIGWMLREVGKRDIRALEGFLKANRGRMPRTMLRYAIERFPENKRLWYLKRTNSIA